MEIKEVIASFLLFSLVFIVNAILTRKLLLLKTGKKFVILIFYPLKLLIYTGVLFIIHKTFGITWSTLVGITLSLIVVSAIIVLTRLR